jgi:hypothetical protein
VTLAALSDLRTMENRDYRLECHEKIRPRHKNMTQNPRDRYDGIYDISKIQSIDDSDMQSIDAYIYIYMYACMCQYPIRIKQNCVHATGCILEPQGAFVYKCMAIPKVGMNIYIYI